MMTREQDIGGAVVRRHFTRGGETMSPGTPMTRDEVLSIPTNNRQSLIDTGKLQIVPPGTSLAPAEPKQRFVINRGPGKWTVIEGRTLGSFKFKADADAFAGGDEVVSGEQQQQEPPLN